MLNGQKALPQLPAIFVMSGGPFHGETILLEDCPASAVFTYREWTGRYLYDARTGHLRWHSHKRKDGIKTVESVT